MSWQLISLIVILVAIGTGMLWYERSRPPSQIVALVAVLAALAVAGRIVLAPIPNVVATTDIVIIAGFVLGPAPGFAVGALGGLVSNFWLGQGVWTPWQMVAWGMCGVAGGVLWKVTGGRVNRWWLAAFCGAAGLAFGGWMNLQTMVSFGGEISLDRYLALEVRAIAFDIAHMTGNIVFALAAGPAMIAALTRFRERFEWRQAENGVLGRTRSTAGVTMIVLGAMLFAFGGPGSTQRAEAAYPTEAGKAATWLKAQQNTDGGFGSTPEGSSSINMTARTMFALAATGTNPLDVRKNNISPYGYLVNNHKQVTKASDIALTILALRTVGQNPKKFNGRNLVKALRNHRGNGSFGNDVNVTAFGALAFRSAGAYNDAEHSVRWLYKAQNDDGGWGISRDAKSDADSTGAALMAITGKKVSGHGVRYLSSIQRDSGGFASGSNVNTQSTGLAIQGVVSTGRGVNYLKKKGNSAANFILARQQADGSIWYSRESDQTRVWVTADTTTALAGKPLPIGAPPREKKDPPANNNGTGGSTPSDSGTNIPGYTPLPPASMVEPSNNFPSGSGNGGNGSGNGNGNGNFGNGNNGNNSDPGYEEQTTPLDTTTTEPDVSLIPDAPTAAVLAASRENSKPSPLIAILIALGVTGGLAGGTILLARRFRW